MELTFHEVFYLNEGFLYPIVIKLKFPSLYEY